MSYSPKLNEAVALALELHADQRRKGGDIPYVTHLFAVAALVGEHGGGETEVIAALLHDASEDQGGPATLARIRAAFGAEVAGIVEACSDTDVVPKPPWRARKEAYVRRMQEVPAGALLVSCADKLHNARCTLSDLRQHGESVWERFSGGRDGTLWYYRSLLTIFEARLSRPLVADLSEVVHDLERFGQEARRVQPRPAPERRA